LHSSIRIELFDGSMASFGDITHTMNTDILFADGTKQREEFLVTRLHPTADVVLGIEWLQRHNPKVDWKHPMTVTFPDAKAKQNSDARACESDQLGKHPPESTDTENDGLSPEVLEFLPWTKEFHLKHGVHGLVMSAVTGNPAELRDLRPAEQTMSSPMPSTSITSPDSNSSSDPNNLSAGNSDNKPTPSAATPLQTITRSKGSPSANAWKFPHVKKRLQENSTASNQKPQAALVAPRVSFVRAPAFASIVRRGDYSLYGTISIKPSTPESKFPSQTTKLPPDEEKDAMDNIPVEYRDYSDVFSDKDARELPPHRQYDHSIDIEPGGKPPWLPIYGISEPELKALREFIDDLLGKGFIRSSNSPAGAPILFARKKDGGLRLCIDYRGLNRITIKSRYPIPLVSNVLDRLRTAKVYSKIDLRWGYHNVRVKEGDEWKTAFRTRYGLFEYLVMPFGLTNAPATFQHFMNDIFRDMVDIFVVVYLDDILIYSDNLEEHQDHVRRVLQRLRDNNLHANPTKSEFHCDSIEYLGFIVTPGGITMDPAKVEVVTTWPEPTNVKELQSFLGFANFYRRFIHKYSALARPLHNLTRKNTRYAWSPQCQTAFDALKTAFTSAPILAHFDPTFPTVVETDSSDYAIAGVLSQINPETGNMHPLAFYSRSMQPAELNYDIYDKELLAIYESFRQWRAYLEGNLEITLVLSDHNNLQYFMTSKQLSRRQARWSEFMSNFNFEIKYRPGRLGTKPDALTRRSDVYPKGEDRAYAQANPHNFHAIFRTEQIRAAHVMDLGKLHARIREALKNDDFAKSQMQRLQNSHAEPNEPFEISDDGLLLRNKLIYVPDHDNLRLEILRMYHDHKLHGHPGIRKTVLLIQRRYFWLHLRKLVTNYVRSCVECARAKTRHHKAYGKLKFLPVPSRPWSSISMDHIEGLPESDGFDSILVVVDRLTKAAVFIECRATDDAMTLATLFLKHVFSKHGAPQDIISDRGRLFVSHFWSALCQLLGIKSNLSTAYHPETDGQTERVNQVLEQYLRFYINYQQDNWRSLLPLAEFAYNNTPHSATQVTPFFANKGYHPKLEIGMSNVSSYAAQQYAEDLTSLHEYLREQIQIAIDQYSRATEDRRIPPPEFKEGSKVWLSTRNIKTKRPSKKLDHRRVGPIKILKKISSHAFRLELPDGLKSLHDVFHVNLLEPYVENEIPNRRQPPPPPVEVDDEPEYEISAVLDSRMRRKKLEYLVEWIGYEDTPEHRTWQPAENLEHAADYVRDFHHRYPHKPGAVVQRK
jgi:RNase H-like domain found in reverse transcriptase/Reverse transcriptase (RNA-dependent DNA polymerase)/Integrase zinc binding domain/Integrase core domain/Chromo (CHRromatin Organisation MOdifier) domain